MKLVGNGDRYKHSDEFENPPDGNIRFRVTRPLVSIFFPYTCNGENIVDTIASSFLLFIKRAGNQETGIKSRTSLDFSQI